ncbi:MAG TPA: Gfo/Idh/MocA family oxidoreductase [Anaerolineae bacterium]|nr:Gfo/Idh/MocA family oxidoreductase [Anaerolineae bacterium]HIQ04848.1 Gfo/Idh/MocA family oxidoreductase [Anaerolineae bacterium]
MKPIEVVLIGAGSRGMDTFGAFALRNPDDVKFVAVAEPDEAKRNYFADQHGIPSERRFASWEEMLSQPQLAPALINASIDHVHFASTMAALEAGYDVLLEKPMAPRVHENVQLVRAAERTGRLLMIAHVLRYTPFFRTVKAIIDEGRLGDLITIEHKENVAFWHMAHSFVRGNWRRADTSAPMILTKSCHDLDLLYWFVGKPTRRLSSFGSLTHFRSDRVGPEIPERCTDGCPIESECPYSAMRIYLGDYTGWPVSVISLDPSYEARLAALKTGPYGRCVFRCDNDVVDHQVVSLEFEGGVTAAFSMYGHSHEDTRTLRIAGARAVLRGHLLRDEITIHEFSSGEVETINPGAGIAMGHAGGDEGLMQAFVRTMRSGARVAALTSARESLESHLMAFAAEESRLQGTVIDMAAYRQRAEAEAAG